MFSTLFDTLDFAATAARIQERKESEVEAALDSASQGIQLTGANLEALLSVAARPYLEPIASIAREITRRRFGNTIQIYAPLYLSNECRSSCTYCGFSFENNIRRRTLTLEEVEREAGLLYETGIRHLLLLTGEDYKNTPLKYLAETARMLRDRFSSISIEVYPLKQEEYELLRTEGVDGLAVYQETYDPIRYAEVHLRGMKKNMRFRLECPDRAGQAGFRKIAVGALLGLSDPAAETFLAALHARYLVQTFWQTQISISLPRLRAAEGLSLPPVIADADYVRYICALRLFLPDAGLNLSTREGADFRDRMSRICITHMSAGSKTEPGGYSGMETDVQFETEDRRSVAEFTAQLRSNGLEPVFTDWSPILK